MNHHQANELLRSIGTKMSNLMFNLAQAKDSPDAKLFDELRREWDAAMAAYRRAPAPTSEPGARDAVLEAACELIAYLDANPPMGDGLWSVRKLRAALATPASPAVLADEQSWHALFDRVAMALNCLPSGYLDGNEHVVRAAGKLAVPAVPSPAPVAPSYGPVHVVADLVRNLLTLDQMLPIYSAFHVDYEGKRRCRTRDVCISKERVVDGKWVESSRKDVAYSVVVWAKPAADPAPQVAQASPELPAVLFDAMAVYEETARWRPHAKISANNVSDVLDAIVRLIKSAPEPSPLVEEAQRIVAAKVEK